MQPPVPWFKWGVFISDDIATDGHGNIVSVPFAGQYRCEQHELSRLMLSSWHSEAHQHERQHTFWD